MHDSIVNNNNNIEKKEKQSRQREILIKIKHEFSYGAERKSQNAMLKPSLISRRRPFESVDHDTYLNQKQPSDIQPVTMRKHYSPVQTPPRLRAYANEST